MTMLEMDAFMAKRGVQCVHAMLCVVLCICIRQYLCSISDLWIGIAMLYGEFCVSRAEF